ncbi:MAG: YciI family protein [Candidatus Delongbacteria bacterium]
MSTWLYRIRPTRPALLSTGPTPAEQALIGRHFAYLQELTQRGIVHLAGRTTTTEEEGMGLVIFSAPGEPEARALMEGDPAVAGGVFAARLFPYRVALLNVDSLAEAQRVG